MKRGRGGTRGIRSLLAGGLVLLLVCTSVQAMGALRPGTVPGAAQALTAAKEAGSAAAGTSGGKAGAAKEEAAPGAGTDAGEKAPAEAGRAADGASVQADEGGTGQPSGREADAGAGGGTQAADAGKSAQDAGTVKQETAPSGAASSGEEAGESAVPAGGGAAVPSRDPEDGTGAGTAGGSAEAPGASGGSAGDSAQAGGSAGTGGASDRTLDPAGADSQAAEASGTSGRSAETSDASGRSAETSDASGQSAGASDASGQSAGTSGTSGQSAGAPGTSGQSAGASGTSGESSQASEGTGTQAADTSSAAQLPEEEEVEEVPWMTEDEFNRAYESVTSGAAGAGASTLSNARIVSKESEISYEDLGIGTHVSGHPGHTTPINVRDADGNDYTGVCVVPDDRGWAKGTVLPNVTRVTDASMIKLYYYTMLDSYGEDLARSRGFGSNAKKVAIAACHEALSMRYAQLAGITYDRPNVGSNLSSLISAYRSGVSSKAAPDAGKVFVYISARTQSGGHWMQAYVFGRVEEDEPSSIVLQKASADADMRNAYNAYYCLHETAAGGTVNFRMYTDKACTKRADVYTDANMTNPLDPIPVGLSGKSGLWNKAVFYVEPGTYYLKELTTPLGYQTHSDPFGPYTLQEGKGKTIKVENTPRYAKAGIIKKDAKTGKVLAGAKFGLYADIEDARNEAEPMGVFTTGADGKSNQLEVLAGKTYYVREIEAPKGYKADDAVRALKAASGFTETAWTEISNEPGSGTVQVEKAPSDPGADLSAADSPYSLAGAQYTLYDAGGSSAGTLTTGADGRSNVLTVPAGAYTLKETKASPGFGVDTKTYNVTVAADAPAVVKSVEPILKGRITLRKHSSEEKEEKAADTAPVAGAVYGLYASEDDARAERAAVGTFVVKEDGTSNVIEVTAGKAYYVKETKAPEGYLPDTAVHVAQVSSLTETVTVESEDRLIFGGVKVCKKDLETEKSAPLGGAALEGAVLRIYNDGERSVYADGKKVLPGAVAMTLTTDAAGTARTNARALSYGSYRIEEAAPPEGYTKKGAKPVRFSIEKDDTLVDLTGKTETSILDQAARGDFSIRKVNAYTKKPMGGVTFEVTALGRDGKAIEKHRFTTDGEGNYESTAAFAAAGKDAGVKRIWFGAGTEPDDGLGALPFGDYRIVEIEGDGNRGMKMFEDTFSIYEDGQVLSLGQIENTLRPVLETELLDEDGDHFADQKGTVTLTDTVTYDGMEDYIGREVTFHGVIHVKETGEPLVIDGSPVECVTTKKILSHTATVQLRFTFDASRAQGLTLVCFEYASEAVSADAGPESSGEGGESGGPGSGTDPAEDGGASGTGPEEAPYSDSTNGGKDIAAHTDLDDAAQTVHLVSIETDARDQLTGMHVGEARDGAVTVDHVTMNGLIPGQAYRVAGFLVDKSNGRPLRAKDGAEVTAEASFTAKAVKETVDLTFTYDASLLAGTTVVAFERLYLGGSVTPKDGAPDSPGSSPAGEDGPSDDAPQGTEPGEEPGEEAPAEEAPIAVHEDPEDEDQSVRYPQIRTHASGEDGENKLLTAGGTLTIRDRVTWRNLLPGRSCRLQGTLMRKDTGEALRVDGAPVTASAAFTPEGSDGETVLSFTFDSMYITEEVLPVVAFEELYLLVPGEGSDGSSGEPREEGTSPGDAPSEEAPSGGDGSGEAPSEEAPQGDAPSDGAPSEETPSEEVLIASHRDLEDAEQTVRLQQPAEPESPEEPGEPGTPETPKTPEKPQTPDEPKTPEKAKGPEKAVPEKTAPASPDTVREAKSAKTGDDTDVLLYLLPAVLAAAGIAVFFKLRRR